MLASLDGGQGDVAVLGVRGGDVDGVDAGIVDQGTIAAVGPRNGVLVGERPSALQGTRAHRHQLAVVDVAEVGRHLGRDSSRASDSPPHLVAHRSSVEERIGTSRPREQR